MEHLAAAGEGCRGYLEALRFVWMACLKVAVVVASPLSSSVSSLCSPSRSGLPGRRQHLVAEPAGSRSLLET
jgi:hypothetical protein